MSRFVVTSCTINDGLALAHNNISAFWTDPSWVLMWPGKTLDQVIAEAVRRMPHNLLMEPTWRRHQKAVDTRFGTIVGYARWILPDANIDVPAASNQDAVWPTAQVPNVGKEQEREAASEFAAADWSYNHALDELDEPILGMKSRLMEGKHYLLLDYLAVHPDNRGQGIATMLVESGIREAEKLGLDVFVHALKAGLGVYRRVGFTLVDQIILDDSKYGGKGECGAYFLVKKSRHQNTVQLQNS